MSKLNCFLVCNRSVVGEESIADEVLAIVLTRHGKVWDGRGAQNRMGKRPLEAAAAVIQDYGLACTPLELNLEVLELLQERFDLAHPCFLPQLYLMEVLQPSSAIILRLGRE